MGKRIVIFGWADRVHIQRWVQGLTNRGCQIKLISLGGEPLPNIDTTVFPRRKRWGYILHAGQAAAEARRFEPDLVHVHNAVGFGLWGLRTRFKPTIVSVWGTDVVEFPSGPFSRSLIRKVLTKADHITATSGELKRVTATRCPGAASKISVVPFGVNLPPEPFAPPSPRPLRLVFAKAHHHRYGPDILIKAMVQVIRVIPDVQLTLAGVGEMSDSLRELITELGLSDTISLPGFIQPEKIYELLREHHIMVMPSRHEAFGVAALEAGACSRPVIAADVGGVSEVVRDGITGVLIPPEDPEVLSKAIIKLGRDEKTRAMMGTEAYSWVRERFQWDKSLDMMTDLYERMIHEKK